MSNKKHADVSFTQIKNKLIRFNQNRRALTKLYAGAIESPSIAKILKQPKTKSVLSASDYLNQEIYNSIQVRKQAKKAKKKSNQTDDVRTHEETGSKIISNFL